MSELIKKTKLFYEKGYKKKGIEYQRKYPNEELCRFMGRNYFDIHPKKRKKIKIMGFVSTIDKIYLSTNNGKIMKVNIADGKIDLIYKVGRDKISKPYVNNSKLYIVKDNAIIKIN